MKRAKENDQFVFQGNRILWHKNGRYADTELQVDKELHDSVKRNIVVNILVFWQLQYDIRHRHAAVL